MRRPFRKLNKLLLGILLSAAGLVSLVAIVVLVWFFRYNYENVRIGDGHYLLRTDRIFGERCVYPARKYLPHEQESIAAEVSANSEFETCF